MKKKFWKIALLIVFILALVSILSAVIFVHSVKSNDSYTAFDTARLNQVYSNLTVLDSNGKPLNEAMYYKNIKQIPLSALPRYTYMAFVAVEDKRFFDHNGIDVKRVAGALVHNLQSKSFKEGASTISQQLIKNTHLDNEKTFKRKVNEMLLARELETNFTKEQILEMYLNTIYFGRNAYGIENAANVYFDKSADNLTISESAILAGMIKAPNTYAPDKNMDKCRQRRDTILGLMQEQGIITDAEYKQAKNDSIVYTPQKKIAEKTYMYYVLKEACKILNMTESQLLSSNYTIKTNCDSRIQQELCALANKDTTVDKKGNLSNLACVVTNNDGRVIACYMRGENADRKGQVGSTFKPIAVYTPALNEKIISQASPVLDEPTNFGGYCPQNVGCQYNGWTTVKYSVAKSLNIPAVKTLNALTLPTAEKYLKKLGFDGNQDLSLALGNVQGGATPFELAKCYSTLANNGTANQLQFIKEIRSPKGIVYSSKQNSTQVFRPTATFLISSATFSATSVMAGYTTQNTFVVWHSGEFDNSITGSGAPCRFASKLLDKMYQNTKPNNFAPPKGVIKLTVDKSSLDEQQLRLSNTGIDFWFDETNRPTEKVLEQLPNYTIKCKTCENGICITLPDIPNATWKLFQQIDNRLIEIPLNNNTYIYQGNAETTFVARLYKDGNLLFETPSTNVYPQKSTDDNKEDKQNKGSILDFWYW